MGRVEDVRRLRLRRAAVLEQRLGRSDEARADLEALVAATGDHLSELRVLADLDERLGDPLRAAPLWLRASGLAADRDEAAELSRRSCQAYLAGGDIESAHRVLEGMGTWVEREKLLELGVEIERRRENPAGLSEALDELVTLSREPEERRAALLVEAARASLAASQPGRALELAGRAARLAPTLADAQLLARHLEYTERGPDAGGDPRDVLAALRGVRGTLTAEQEELRSFLIAEALERAGDGDAALSFLEGERARLGPRPLLALGIAERRAARGESSAAVEAFEHALGGDLMGLRRPGEVALGAGEVARRAGDFDRAERYLESAALDPALAPAAESALEVLRADRAAERELAQSGAPPKKAGGSEPPPIPLVRTAPFRSERPFAEPEVVRAHVVIDEDDEPPTTLSEAPPAAPDAVRAAPAIAPESPGPASAAPPTSAPARLVPELSVPPIVWEMRHPPSISDATSDASGLVTQKPPSPRAASLSGTFVGNTETEVKLHIALSEGSREAGLELCRVLEGQTDRVHDLVWVCRRLALVTPGDPLVLARLARAARDDRHIAYAVAVEHVLDLVRPAPSPPRPPSLDGLDVHPDAVRGLLFRETTSRTLDALALVWDTAEHLFRRDPGAYGITGLERIAPMAPTPLAHAYAGAARALGSLRTPLFQRRTAGPVTVGVALLTPPSVVLSGDVQAETPELHFHLGAMLAAASPQLVMLFGLPESQARSVLSALGFAFGPTRPDASRLGPALRLAEMLWEAIPARPQRRLRELCDDPETLAFDQAMLQARLAVRRAGLFVAGDFAVAAHEVCAEEGRSPDGLRSPQGLFELCGESPSIQSLYALALSPEYAEMRWHGARGSNRPGS